MLQQGTSTPGAGSSACICSQSAADVAAAAVVETALQPMRQISRESLLHWQHNRPRPSQSRQAGRLLPFCTLLHTNTHQHQRKPVRALQEMVCESLTAQTQRPRPHNTPTDLQTDPQRQTAQAGCTQPCLSTCGCAVNGQKPLAAPTATWQTPQHSTSTPFQAPPPQQHTNTPVTAPISTSAFAQRLITPSSTHRHTVRARPICQPDRSTRSSLLLSLRDQGALFATEQFTRRPVPAWLQPPW